MERSRVKWRTALPQERRLATAKLMHARLGSAAPAGCMDVIMVRMPSPRAHHLRAHHLVRMHPLPSPRAHARCGVRGSFHSEQNTHTARHWI